MNFKFRILSFESTFRHRIFKFFRNSCLEIRNSRRAGFTMVEIVVMLAILVMISGILLGNFTGFNENGALTRTAQELAVDLRRGQNITLSVSRVRLADGSVYGASPKGIGIHFDKSAGSSKRYITFLEDRETTLPGSIRGIFDPADKIVATTQLQRNVSITRIYADEPSPSPCNIDFTSADIVFMSPEAAVVFAGDSVTPIDDCSFLKIELTSPTLNFQKTIT